MSKPVVTDRMREGLARMQNNTDFTLLRDYVQARYDHVKDTLVTASEGEAFTSLQGRARELQDLLKIITNKPKE